MVITLEPIHVELSATQSQTGGTVSIATSLKPNMQARGDAVICELARKLVAGGVSPDTKLSIWRGTTKCFEDVPVARWAALTVWAGRFVKHVPYKAPLERDDGLPGGVTHQNNTNASEEG